MDKNDLELIELSIDLKASKKAKDMGVVFQTKAKIKEGCLELLVRIKANNPNNSEFAEYIGHLILDKYSCTVRFSYPTNLKSAI